MGYKLYILLQVFWTITPIWAAFNDFVIENERDLERFGVQNGEMMYDDEDLEYQLLNEYEDETYGAIGDSCGSCGHMSSGYDGAVSMSDYEGISNEAILKEVIRQLSNDARFQHFKEYLTEDNLLLSYKDEKSNRDLLTPDFTNVYENEHN